MEAIHGVEREVHNVLEKLNKFSGNERRNLASSIETLKALKTESQGASTTQECHRKTPAELTALPSR